MQFAGSATAASAPGQLVWVGHFCPTLLTLTLISL